MHGTSATTAPKKTDSLIRRYFPTFASSLAFALAFPTPLFPSGLWPLVFLPFALLEPVFAEQPRTALHGAFFGSVSSALMASYLLNYHWLLWLAVVGFQSLSFALVFALASRSRVCPRWLGPIFIAAVWTTFDFVKSAAFSFPYGVVGYALAPVPFLARSAAVGGVWLPGFLVIAISVYAREAIGYATAKRVRRSVIAGIALIVACASLALPRFLLNADFDDWGKARIALVQTDRHGPYATPDEYGRTLDACIRLSESALADDPDIVFWQESAFVPALEWNASKAANPYALAMALKLRRYAEKSGKPLVFGSTWAIDSPSGRLDYNAALETDDGRTFSRYLKTRLVPVAEYLPFEQAFPRFARWIRTMFGFSWTPGTGPSTLRAAGIDFGTPVCFEDGFGDLCAGMLASGARFLVVITDDAWSGDEAMYRQHLAMSVIRAIEGGSWVGRSSASGITALIAPDGYVVEELPTDREGVLTREIGLKPAGKTTPYLAWGDYWAWACATFACLALLVPLGLRIAGRTLGSEEFKATRIDSLSHCCKNGVKRDATSK